MGKLSNTFFDYFYEDYGKVAYVFDVDDCLVRTEDKITITDGKFKGEYSTDEWAAIDHTLIPKEYIDLNQFYGGLKNAKPITKNIEILVNHLKDNDDVFILSARGGSRNVILKDLIDVINDANFKLLHKTDFKPRERLPIKNVITLYDPWVRKVFGIPDIGIPKEKAYILRDVLLGKMGYDKVVFYDDDAKNIKAASQIPGVEAIQV